MLTDNPEALGKVYNVAIGENFTVNYLYQACLDRLNSTFPAQYRGTPRRRYPEFAGRYQPRQKLLGYQPTKRFEDGVGRDHRFFKTNTPE